MLLHSPTKEALPTILSQGLKVMARNGMHFAPFRYNDRQANYFASRQTPHILVWGANRSVYEDKHSFFRRKTM